MKEDTKRLSKSDLEMGNDLQKKCAQDTVSAVQRMVELCDSHAMATFVAVGGVIGSSGMLMALMSEREEFNKLSGAELHDNALFAMIFAWLCDHKQHKSKLDDMMPKAVKMWEHITGRTFDKSWLIGPMQEPLG